MPQERALPREIWSGNPEDFSQGGRDNIDVEIVKARYAPDHYPNRVKHFCFFRVTYRNLEDENDTFTEKYRMGFLNQVVPTNSPPGTPKDEIEFAGGDQSVYDQLGEGTVQLEESEIEDFEGLYITGAPEKDGDFLIWLRALVDCGFTPNGPGLASDVEGLKLHLDRGKGSVYKDKESQQEKASSILLPSAILGGTKKSAGAGKTSASSATKSATKAESKPATSASAAKNAKSNGSAALDSIAEAITEIIDTHGSDGSYEKGKVITKLVKTEQYKALNGEDRKAATDAFNNDTLFTASRGLVYDSDDDMISKL